MTVLVVVLAVALAAANGGNDVAKGVATLAGAGVTRYRTAVVYGALTTLAGALISVWLGDRMAKLFSSGIVAATPTDGFAVAVLAGAGAWVGLATALRLPVSTTHALVGALIGAGLGLDAAAVNWAKLATGVAQPLLLSVLVAYLLSAALAIVARTVAGRRSPDDAAEPVAAEALYAGVPPLRPSMARRVPSAAHWISAGAVGAARGLNDTPKLAAVAAFTLVPAGMTTTGTTALVAGAMFAGALAAGGRVARRLGEGVIRFSHDEGLRANLTTSVLVGAGAGYGLPMSTTHVSTGAIAGVAGTRPSRLNARTLRDFALAWTATPLLAGTVAVTVHALAV